MSRRTRWTAAALTIATTLAVAGSASGLLRDMAAHWAAPLITALEAHGVVAGDSEGNFHPDDPLTRAQMAKFIVSGIGSDADARLLARYDSRFRDVPAGHWAAGYVEALAEMGVTQGYGDGTFGPSDVVTRAQMAVFLVRAAGLADEARGLQFKRTPFTDDERIPGWARGAINAALAHRLVTGFEDMTFRPDLPITRAEGGATLLRLMYLQGSAFHLSGTLVEYDPGRRRGVVRDAVGQERPFAMTRDAVFFRGGVPVEPLQVQVLDQVWLVLDDRGRGLFLDARATDLLGRDAVVEGDQVTLTMRAGNRRTFSVQPGALIFHNGHPADLAAIHGSPEVYLALDRTTGEVRVLDSVHAPLEATLGGWDAQARRLLINTEADAMALAIAPDAVLLLNGERVSAEALEPGDRLRIALDEQGNVIYLQAER